MKGVHTCARAWGGTPGWRDPPRPPPHPLWAGYHRRPSRPAPPAGRVVAWGPPRRGGPTGGPPPLRAPRGTRYPVLAADSAVADLAGFSVAPTARGLAGGLGAGSRRTAGRGEEGRRASAARGEKFRPQSERLGSFGRAGRCQSQANTAPSWARRGAAATGGAGARRGPGGN